MPIAGPFQTPLLSAANTPRNAAETLGVVLQFFSEPIAVHGFTAPAVSRFERVWIQ